LVLGFAPYDEGAIVKAARGLAKALRH